MGILYKITSPNGKAYIGITMQPIASRLRQHRRKPKTGKAELLKSAISKYGMSEMIVEVLKESSDWSELCQMEKDAIALFNTFAPSGYNLTIGGEGVQGRKHSTESKKMMSETHRTHPRPKELLQKAAAAYWASPHGLNRLKNAEERKRIESSKIKPTRSEAVKLALSDPLIRKRMSDSAKKRDRTPEFRARISEGNKRAWARIKAGKDGLHGEG